LVTRRKELEDALRYLTKYTIYIGIGMSNKVYYDGKPEYANQKIKDSFLLTLSERVSRLTCQLLLSGSYEVKIENRNWTDDDFIRTDRVQIIIKGLLSSWRQKIGTD
jgi:hypothetical protein